MLGLGDKVRSSAVARACVAHQLGGQIPADVRLIETHDMFCSEMALTGKALRSAAELTWLP